MATLLERLFINIFIEAEAHDKKDAEKPSGSQTVTEGLGNLLHHHKGSKMRFPWLTVLKVAYVILAIFLVLFCISSLAVTIISAMAYKVFTSDQSGRVVGVVLLAVGAGVALTATIYSTIAIFMKKNKHLKASAGTFLMLAVIQAIICGVSIRVTLEDETLAVNAMTESFQLSRQEERHHRIWSSLQHELECCGVNSADDYKNSKHGSYFPPDIPVSCCPDYDPSRSEMVQETTRMSCKTIRQYYNVGCRYLVVHYLKTSVEAIIGVTVVLIVLEVISVLLIMAAFAITNKGKEKKKQDKQANVDVETTAASNEHTKSAQEQKHQSPDK